MIKRIENVIEKGLGFLINNQKGNGEFRAYYQDGKNNDFTYVEKFPFMTASIIFTLIDINNKEFDIIKDKVCSFLESTMEKGGYWRYQPFKVGYYTYPADIDDTSLSSIILVNNGISVPENKKYLYYQKDTQGYIYSWILPRWQYLRFIRHWLHLLYDLKYTSETLFIRRKELHNMPLVEYTAKEPGVAANALIYLGENDHTRKSIDLIINEMLEQTTDYNRGHYDPVTTYYHISRAFRNGVSKFKVLGDFITKDIINYYKVNEYYSDSLHTSAIISTLLNFKMDTAFLSDAVELVLKKSEKQDWDFNPYFKMYQKDDFNFGCPEITCAFCLEALNKYKDYLLNKNN